jgi:hypothetical protein
MYGPRWTLHIEIQTGQTCLFVFLQADDLFISAMLLEKSNTEVRGTNGVAPEIKLYER